MNADELHETEDRLALAASRGSHAQSLMNDELLAECFKNLEEAYIATWRSTNFDDVQGREKLFIAINVIGKVKEQLGRVAANGELAKAEIEELVRAAERKKRFGLF
ncbi:hypothetical protein EOW77_0032340 [Bradyrhizobium yuanmingense]|uniref:hypothetical protein n=1 Tax=Bradyrhizobium yuanmingense TaxID=108015 RepID=UPI000FE3B920|nr:hypothetical protein [Bradyrhizobium yuanmingense]TGN75958.1 hypothetical protein EOW77_0032340 [Bradyrhizobium yuanmingense]